MRGMAGLLMMLLSWSASAQEVTCRVLTTVKQEGAHPMQVACDNKQSGFLSSEEKPASLSLRTISEMGDRELRKLKDPPGTVSDYHHPQHNPWIREQVKKMRGVEDYRLEALHFAQEPKLFANPVGNGLAREEDESFREGLHCFSPRPALIAKQTNGGDAKTRLCFYPEVVCNFYRDGEATEARGSSEAICPVQADGGCPSATVCAKDPSAYFDVAPTVVAVEPAGKGSKKKSGGAQ